MASAKTAGGDATSIKRAEIPGMIRRFIFYESAT
jgi:hypothetical protein